MTESELTRLIKRELEIETRGVRLYFTPGKPIDAVSLFKGRSEHVARSLRALLTPGEHIVVFGKRGVGKSSLARVTAQLLLKDLRTIYYMHICDSDDDYNSIWAPILGKLGFGGIQVEETTERTEGGGAQLRIPFAEAGVDTHTRKSVKVVSGMPTSLKPSTVAEFLTDVDALILIDELDRLRSDHDRIKLAETIKQLSDRGARTKVLLVGIADTAAQLVAAHPSIERCLREIELKPMSDDEIRDIIVENAAKCEVAFEEEAVGAIVAMAAGYPYFAHLLGLKCAEEAVADGSSIVSSATLQKAVEEAVDDAEATLKNGYLSATRSHASDNYATILEAAAAMATEEFTFQELLSAVRSQGAPDMSDGSLSNYLRHLASDDASTVLCRVAKGVYRFTDPRMPAFVLIAGRARRQRD